MILTSLFLFSACAGSSPIRSEIDPYLPQNIGSSTERVVIKLSGQPYTFDPRDDFGDLGESITLEPPVPGTCTSLKECSHRNKAKAKFFLDYVDETSVEVKVELMTSLLLSYMNLVTQIFIYFILMIFVCIL